eukprot:TRINITY_DN10904_c0_g1_i1.p3 TRINITY_DN10904_c0_g1~~TRINITY_DN10904_c0_g1_i1.p3  ORF type:complete len:210 (-),score=38.31 TRINITY_DN10904_c0_g1_i1:25-603(-)
MDVAVGFRRPGGAAVRTRCRGALWWAVLEAGAGFEVVLGNTGLRRVCVQVEVGGVHTGKDYTVPGQGQRVVRGFYQAAGSYAPFAVPAAGVAEIAAAVHLVLRRRADAAAGGVRHLVVRGRRLGAVRAVAGPQEALRAAGVAAGLAQSASESSDPSDPCEPAQAPAGSGTLGGAPTPVQTRGRRRTRGDISD